MKKFNVTNIYGMFGIMFSGYFLRMAITHPQGKISFLGYFLMIVFLITGILCLGDED